MNKISLDLYGCKNDCMENKIEDSLQVYKTAQDVCDLLEIRPIFKPLIIPYFYGKNPKDNGVSCFCYFKENDRIGFFTMHTFSKRKAVYFDLVSKQKFNLDHVSNCISKVFNAQKVTTASKFKPSTWGVELVANGTAQIEQNKLYDLVQDIIKNINMTQIANTIIEKNKHTTLLTTLIAESHIAVLFNSKTKYIYLDIFSCKYYNYKDVLNLLGQYKINIKNHKQSSRGIYHEIVE